MHYDYVEFEREREREREREGESRVAWFHGAYVALTSVTLWPKAYALNPKPCWKKEQKKTQNPVRLSLCVRSAQGLFGCMVTDCPV